MAHRALIIACGRYAETTKLRPLVAPPEEARELEQLFLDESIGAFDSVDVVVDKASHEVSKALERFLTAREVRKDDLVLVYFSGHGVKHEGLLYLAFADLDPATPMTSAVSSELLDRLMRRCSAGRQVLILDCCYSGAYESSMSTKGDDAVGVAELFKWPIGMAKLRGRTVIASSDSLQYAFESEVDGQVRSIFTREVIAALRSGEAANEEGYVSVGNLFDVVVPRVLRHASGQRPKMFHHGDSSRSVMIARAPSAVMDQLREQGDRARRWKRRNDRIEWWRSTTARFWLFLRALPRLLLLVVAPGLVVSAAATMFFRSLSEPVSTSPDGKLGREQADQIVERITEYTTGLKASDAGADPQNEAVMRELGAIVQLLKDSRERDNQKQMMEQMERTLRALVELQNRLPNKKGDTPAPRATSSAAPAHADLAERTQEVVTLLRKHKVAPTPLPTEAPTAEGGAPAELSGSPAFVCERAVQGRQWPEAKSACEREAHQGGAPDRAAALYNLGVVAEQGSEGRNATVLYAQSLALNDNARAEQALDRVCVALGAEPRLPADDRPWRVVDMADRGRATIYRQPRPDSGVVGELARGSCVVTGSPKAGQGVQGSARWVKIKRPVALSGYILESSLVPAPAARTRDGGALNSAPRGSTDP